MTFYNKARTMTDKTKERQELSQKLKLGIEKARRQLIESRAAKNENLIIGDKDGHFKSVPAKDLLPTVPKHP